MIIKLLLILAATTPSQGQGFWTYRGVSRYPNPSQPEPCPVNMHRDRCANQPQQTCYHFVNRIAVQPNSRAMCRSGCVCNAGYVLHAGMCVPATSCEQATGRGGRRSQGYQGGQDYGQRNQRTRPGEPVGYIAGNAQGQGRPTYHHGNIQRIPYNQQRPQPVRVPGRSPGYIADPLGYRVDWDPNPGVNGMPSNSRAQGQLPNNFQQRPGNNQPNLPPRYGPYGPAQPNPSRPRYNQNMNNPNTGATNGRGACLNQALRASGHTVGGMPMVGRFVPQCSEDGSFKARQCHGSTGQCWCVDKQTGREMQGTRTNPGQQPPRCEDKQTAQGQLPNNFQQRPGNNQPNLPPRYGPYGPAQPNPSRPRYNQNVNNQNTGATNGRGGDGVGPNGRPGMPVPPSPGPAYPGSLAQPPWATNVQPNVWGQGRNGMQNVPYQMPYNNQPIPNVFADRAGFNQWQGQGGNVVYSRTWPPQETYNNPPYGGQNNNNQPPTNAGTYNGAMGGGQPTNPEVIPVPVGPTNPAYSNGVPGSYPSGSGAKDGYGNGQVGPGQQQPVTGTVSATPATEGIGMDASTEESATPATPTTDFSATTPAA